MKTIDPDTAERPVFVLSERYAAFNGPWHAHRRSQLVYASDGMLTTRTATGLWVVPPQRAIWIPANERHQGSAARGFHLKTLYADPRSVARLPKVCCVVAVDPLLEALLTEAASFGMAYPSRGPQQRLIRVILDRLAAGLQTVPSHLPLPQDGRLRRLTARLERDPADPRPLEALAAASGMTARTAARHFLKDTGLTFAQWRQQLRLLKAMQALGRGRRVTEVAAEVGYNDVSAFIAVFRRAFGDTPARYFRSRTE